MCAFGKEIDRKRYFSKDFVSLVKLRGILVSRVGRLVHDVFHVTIK